MEPLSPAASVALGQGGTGAAVILNDPQKGLGIFQRADQIEAARQRFAAQQAARQQAERLKRFDTALQLKTETGLPYQEYLDTQALAASNQLYKDYNTPGLDETELARRSTQTKLAVETDRLLGKKIYDATQKAAAGVTEDTTGEVNPVSFKKALNNVFYDDKGQLVAPRDFDLGRIDAVRQDTTHYNPGVIYKNFVNGVFKASTEDDAKAGNFGGTSTSSKRTSLFFEQKPDGTVVRDKNGTPVVKVSDDLLHLADGNERIRLLLDREQQDYEKKQAEQKVRIEAGASEPVLPNLQRKDLLGHVLTNFGYSKFDESASRVRPLPAPKASAAEKMSVGEVTATPTTGSMASRFYRNDRTVTEKLRGEGIVTNNIPMVGTSFASGNKPYVPVVVDIRGGVILGSNGEVSMKPNEKNNKSDMQLNGRHFVLEVGGKRLGQSQQYATDQEAYQGLLQSINRLTPEQARTASLSAYYSGTIADKSKIKGDGVGRSGAAPTAYYDNQNQLITPEEAKDLVSKGEAVRPASYGGAASEERSNVLIPATQAVDAQLRRATKNRWDPTQRTEQERQAIALLRAKGGQVRDPYSTTGSARPAAAPTSKPATRATPTSTRPPSKMVGDIDL